MIRGWCRFWKIRRYDVVVAAVSLSRFGHVFLNVTCAEADQKKRHETVLRI